MKDESRKDNQFTMYEYIEVNIKQNLAQLCSDCYHALGWIIIDSSSGLNTVKLKLKRDRKIKHRGELYELQHKCEDAFIAIEKLERRSNSKH